jgi:metal transporter CNNM
MNAMESIPTLLTALVLVGMSGICSGLNISLMSLEPSDLRRRAKHGNKRARAVLPLRTNSHLTLASILLINVAVATATALVLESRFSGVIAGIASTLLLVFFGEIFPQALFMRKALHTVARFAPMLRLMIIISYPLSKPTQLLLDKLFGTDNNPKLHTRRELSMIVSEHLGADKSELDEDEVEIMRGALALSDKRVRDITTDIAHTFWLTPDTLLNPSKIDEIKDNNWSRIPIFNRKLTQVHGILLMKDLVDIDFDTETHYVKDMPLHSTRTVGSMTALDTMFRKFIAARTHMMPVEKNDHIIGVVTIEDLLEEILGHEIEDESDAHHDRHAMQD